MEQAVNMSVEYAIAENLLDGYFKSHKAEVMGMILSEYDEAETLEGEYNYGYEDGHKDGEAKKAEDIALRMIKAGKLSLEDIALYARLSFEKVESLASLR